MSASKDHPTFDSLRSSGTGVQTSMDMLRVHWSLFGPLQSSVDVADTLDPGFDCQQYTTDGRSFHQISTSSATEPPISTISVAVDVFEEWEYDWVEEHRDDDEEDQEWIEDEDGEDRKLVRCCGMARPQAPPSLKVLPTTHHFVTVHDYITQVHAWLQTLQTGVLEAMGEMSSSSTTLYINLLSLNNLTLEEDIRADAMWKVVGDHARRRRDGTMIS
ncbi:hypothetical protein GQ44DRAFT_718521 [Phaeosphaeriaceae sp. PMI808]|nr:hypothetical protein GQ44DRAFT_718521 [Phaeosphaeriaceae sp. PMI808]